MITKMTFAATMGPFNMASQSTAAFIPDVWARYIILTIVAVTIALLLHHVFYSLGFKMTRRRPGIFEDLLLKHSERPTRVLLPLLAAMWVVRQSSVPQEFVGTVSHALGLAIIGCIGWLLIDLSNIFREIVVERYDLTLADNYSARRIHTQVTVLRRVLVVVIVLLTIALMLMTFQQVRHFGETVAASAGLAGIVAGLAARSTLSSLIAGIQVAITQPIKLEDVVIVEGEWGRIEEILTTFVVVRIWDQRRMIVPLTYFIDKPFQNWTRRSSDIMGTVFLYVDYTVPVEEIRQELQRIVQSSSLWDGRVCGLQVTNTTDKAMELRCLMSSADSSKSFDLRALVRERLIAYIQKHHPESLPQVRAVLGNVGTAGGNENGALVRGVTDGNEGRAT
ncbi:MAG: small-conductance mechanosensitive channel [Candidatus Angelobacter sp.]|jgi:small-conductance mechanosensitive channel|nr:small-conductance mechanosensitive channel [Candidatus Angelobacter sp.]